MPENKNDSPVQQLKEALDLIAVKEAAIGAAQASLGNMTAERDAFAKQVADLTAAAEVRDQKLNALSNEAAANTKALSEAVAKCEQLSATLALHPQFIADAGAKPVPVGSAQAATTDPAAEFARAYANETDPAKKHAIWKAHNAQK